MKRFFILFCSVFALASTHISNIGATEYADEYTINREDSPKVSATDVYDLSITLKVPQVRNNSSSRGYRKFESQKIKGDMYVNWMDDGSFRLSFGDLCNKNFLVGGYNVTYVGIEDRDVVYSRFVYIGNNNNNEFRTPCLTFYFELEPSYAIGEASEDNSFYLLLSGYGISRYKKKYDSIVATMFRGYASGTQGCGCSAYLHKSPTRIASEFGPTEFTDDVVASFGTWRANWRKRILR